MGEVIQLGRLRTCEDPLCVLPNPHEGEHDYRAPVVIDYTNWKDRRARRRISPTGGLVWMSNEPWHPAEQWLVPAICHEDGKHKYFALSGIHAWREQ